MDRRNYVNYDLNPNPNKRRIIGPAVQKVPWYSVHRPRNIIAISVVLTSLIFLKPISDICSSLKNSIRLFQVQESFKRELDEEERKAMGK